LFGFYHTLDPGNLECREAKVLSDLSFLTLASTSRFSFLVMAELKTKKTEASVDDFISSVEDPEQREDARALLRLMQNATGEKPKMWGTSIVGFGEFHYRYASGHEGDTCISGFSPRSKKLTIYLIAGFKNMKPMMKRLGKHSTGVGCLYVRRLADVDTSVLESMVRQGVKDIGALRRAASSSSPKGGAKAAKGRTARRARP
jgi:hypothetical protein